ncbi:MAG: NAD(P)H-dependent oxidoreductase [Thalassovita sp.]
MPASTSKTALIVLTHPDADAFTGHWAKASGKYLAEQGYEVLWSDLYGAGFDPVERPQNHPGYHSRPFDVLKAQEAASNALGFAEDVTAEMAKLRAADLTILHFPLWWFSPPAVLKGWCERVLANGAMHDAERRFDQGDFRGKQVLFCVSTGSSAAESQHNGKEGDSHMLLWPLAYTFRYLGFDVLQAELVHGVHGYHRDARKSALEARLAQLLEDHADTIRDLPARARVAFNADTEFEDGQLKADAPQRSHFIRHSPD